MCRTLLQVVKLTLLREISVLTLKSAFLSTIRTGIRFDVSYRVRSTSVPIRQNLSNKNKARYAAQALRIDTFRSHL
jgi:hypothetical protein